ncbi:Mvl [Trypoxylus dichotomus]
MLSKIIRKIRKKQAEDPGEGTSTQTRDEDGLPKIKRQGSYYMGRRLSIPDNRSKWSFKKLWAFAGPGFLMSIAYLDPGNIESDLRCGALAGYSLLWVLLFSSIMGLFMQRLAIRLGVVTGLHLAEMCFRQYRKLPRIILWFMVEIAIIASDAQEVIGTAIAIYLLSNEKVPLWAGATITIFDTLTFLCFDKYGLRKLELFFCFFITVMGISFGYQYVVSQPDHLQTIKGTFLPICPNCDYAVLVQGIAIVGAIIMPHNIYLHSALVKSRVVDKANSLKIKEANMYYFIEASVAVFFSICINIFVVAVFAKGFYRITNKELLEKCQRQYGNITIIPDNDEFVEVTLHSGGLFLSCTYGLASKYIWGIGILASGQSATMTGTYAGQFAMEGFLNLEWARWIKVLVTRSIAVTPTVFLAIFTRIEEMTIMNDVMNIINCVQLPFAAIPIIAFTSSTRIMGDDFVNNWINKGVAILLSIVVIAINSYFVVATMADIKPHAVLLMLVAVYALLYFVFCVYLIVHMVVFMSKKDFSENNFIKKYVMASTAGYSSF